MLIQVRDAYKSYGEQVLLEGAEVSIVGDVKLGFVGRNGAGKSTLLRVMLGDEELDRGEVIRSTKLRVGYLRQHDPFLPGESVLDFLMRDSGQPDWKCGEVASEFELKGPYLEGLVKGLSGGWQTRVKLAALLLHEPNLLLLDEPTNFLDLRTQILLEHFLRNFKEACLIVSHDRAFLRSTCTHTLALSRGKLTLFPGKIDAYLEHERERREHDERVNATVQSKQKQLQRFIDKNRANANTASQARSKNRQLQRLKLTEIEVEEPRVHIRAPIVVPRQGPAVRCVELSIGYPDHVVAADIGLEIEHGERVAIVGDNGQGKTTFLRTLVDSLKPMAGHVRWGHGCDIGTYAQHVYQSLPERYTVLEYLEYKALPGTTNQEIMAVAGSLLFRDSHTKKKVTVLSGGERARLCMAGLLLGEHNVLVLDEPGNHLDVETVEALADALLIYKGTVVFTSHDRHFVQRIATSVIEVREGTAKNYYGGYETYLYAVNKEIDEGERANLAARGKERKGNSSKSGEAKTDNAKSMASPAKELDPKDDRKLRKEISNVERKIARLDDQRKELEQRLLKSTDPAEALRLHHEMEQVKSELEREEERWMELQDGM